MIVRILLRVPSCWCEQCDCHSVHIYIPDSMACTTWYYQLSHATKCLRFFKTQSYYITPRKVCQGFAGHFLCFVKCKSSFQTSRRSRNLLLPFTRQKFSEKGLDRGTKKCIIYIVADAMRHLKPGCWKVSPSIRG